MGLFTIYIQSRQNWGKVTFQNIHCLRSSRPMRRARQAWRAWTILRHHGSCNESKDEESQGHDWWWDPDNTMMHHHLYKQRVEETPEQTQTISSDQRSAVESWFRCTQHLRRNIVANLPANVRVVHEDAFALSRCTRRTRGSPWAISMARSLIFKRGWRVCCPMEIWYMAANPVTENSSWWMQPLLYFLPAGCLGQAELQVCHPHHREFKDSRKNAARQIKNLLYKMIKLYRVLKTVDQRQQAVQNSFLIDRAIQMLPMDHQIKYATA